MNPSTSANGGHDGPSLLLLTRDKSIGMELKKYRGEFTKIFMTGEEKSAERIVDRENSNPNKPGVDIVLVDCEPLSLKMIEYLHLREKNPKFKSCPLIALAVVVTPETIDSLPEIMNSIDRVGGVHSYIEFSAGRSFLRDVLNVVHNRTAVEDAFRDVEFQRNVKKIPFLPLFNPIAVDNRSNRTRKESGNDEDWSMSQDAHESRSRTQSLEAIFGENADDGNESHQNFDSIHSPNVGKLTRVPSSKLDVLSLKTNVNIIDKKFRPKWSGKLKEERSSSVFSSPRQSVDQDQLNIRSLYDRTIPDISRGQRTVGGLNKPLAQQYWRMKIPPPFDISVSRRSVITNTSSNGSSPHRRRSSELHFRHSNSLNSAIELSRQLAVALASTRSSTKFHYLDNIEKTLKKNIKETPEDIQVHKIIDIEVSDRLSNLAEIEHIEKGRQMEREGDVARAIFFYSRAGVVNKSSHLSKIFLGNIHYREQKYFIALQFYTAAQAMLARNMYSTNYVRYDDFVAHFNKAVVQFRIGSDENGLEDLQHAVKLNEDNTQAKEVLAIAYRRMGKYNQAIETRTKIDIDMTSKSTLSDGTLSAASTLRTHSSQGKKSRKSMVSRESSDSHPKAADEMCFSLAIPEPRGALNFRERKFMAIREMKKVTDEHAGIQDSLSSYKVLHGFQNGIFETLFLHPSSLQEALLIAPENRTSSHSETIASYLQSVPMLKDVSKSSLIEIASEVEYRIISSKMDLFEQDRSCDCLCVVIRGSLQLTLETSDLERMIIGEIPSGFSFGAIDLLFSNSNSNVFEELATQLEMAMPAATPLPSNLPTPSCSRPLTASAMAHSPNGRLLGSHSIDPNRGEGVLKDVMRNRDMTENSSHSSSSDSRYLYDNNNVPSPVRTPGKDFEDQRIIDQDEDIKDLKVPTPVKAGRHGTPSHLTSKYGGDLAISKLSKSPQREKMDNNMLDRIPNSRPKTSSGVPSLLERQNSDSLRAESQYRREMDRVLSGDLFCNATVNLPPVEVLMISASLFSSFLQGPVLAQFYKRIESIQACGVFSGWSKPEIFRLARMGRVFSYKPGDIALEQDSVPQNFCVVMGGMLKYYKKPNAIEMIRRKLNAIKLKAQHYDTKYCYNHRLQDMMEKERSLSPSRLNDDNSCLQSTNGGESHCYSTSSSVSSSAFSHSHVTIAEKVKRELDAEVAYWEGQLNRELIIEGMRESAKLNAALHSTSKGATRSSMFNDFGCNSSVCSQPSLDEETKEDDQYCEIGSLSWPMIFGEDCVLDPEDGHSRGKVVAETACDVFSIHFRQLQTFRVEQETIDRIQTRSLKYPEDDKIIETMKKKKTWQSYRDSMIKTIPKERWPKSLDEVDPFVV